MTTSTPAASVPHNRTEAAIRELNDRLRTAPQRGRELFRTRRHRSLLRELGQLHYDAHRDRCEVDRPSIESILAELDELTGSR